MQNICVDLGPVAPEPVPAQKHREPIHGAFVGGSLGIAPLAVWGSAGLGLTSSFRVGLQTRDGWQIALDASPGTLLFGQGPAALGLFDAVVTGGILVRLDEGLSWIFRLGFGGGVIAGASSPYYAAPPPPLGFLEARADLFGVALRTGHRTLFEFTGPSARAILFPSSLNHDLLYMLVIGVAFDRFL